MLISRRNQAASATRTSSTLPWSFARATATRVDLGHNRKSEGSVAAAFGKSRLKSLDSLRGIAALIVVFLHCATTYYPRGLPGWIEHSPLSILVAGDGSVRVFFALSGFVLFMALKDATGFQYLPYVAKRFMRLYPPFAAAILTSAVLYDFVKPQAIPALGYWFSLSWNVPPSIGLIAGTLAMTDKPALQGLDIVMWSLVQEVRISIAFPLIAWCVTRNWQITTIVALSLSFVCHYVAFYHPSGWLYDPIQATQYVFLFAGGAALSLNAQTIRRWLGKAPPWSKVSLWIAALAFSALPINVTIAEYAALMIVTLCLDPALDAVLAHGFLTWLGKISYSLYLVHLLVLLTLVHLFFGKVPLQYILLATVLLSLLFAELAYCTVEKPCLDLGRRFALLLAVSDSRRAA
jgi:peptidoglycan/LPS O-acetylase OafA/YrhL